MFRGESAMEGAEEGMSAGDILVAAIDPVLTKQKQVTLRLTDGRVIGPFSVGAVRSLGVANGVIANDLEARLAAEDAFLSGLAVAYDFLARGSATEWELSRYLKRRDIPTDVANRIVHTLRERRLLDDQAVAVRMAERAAEDGRSRSQRQVEAKMLRRGVSLESVAEALQAVPFDESERALAEGRARLATLRQKSLHQREQDAERGKPRSTRDLYNRVARSLAQKGYRSGTIRSVMRRLQEDDRDDGVQNVDIDDDQY